MGRTEINMAARIKWNFVKFKFYNYRDSDRKEIKDIAHFHSNSFGIADVENGSHFFKMDENGKNPVITEDQVQLALNQIENVVPRSFISEPCASLVTYIYGIACSRIENKTFEKFNSPTVLFLAEFSAWLKKVRDTEIDEGLLKEFEKRENYLLEILHHQIFELEVNKPHEIGKNIFFLMNQIHEEIIPRIKWKIESSSIRDHFQRLFNCTEAYFKKTSNALFYLFTDMKNFEDFDIAIFDTAKKINPSLKSIEETKLGEIFIKMEKIKLASDSNSLSNYFLDCDGEFSPESSNMVTQLIRTDKKTGINKELIEFSGEEIFKKCLIKLIYILGYINDLSKFASLFKNAYILAGDGGDIGISHFLGKDILLLTHFFNQIILKIDDGLKFLKAKNSAFYQKCLNEGMCQEFQRHYIGFISEYKKTAQLKEELMKTTTKITEAITVCSSKKYQDDVREKIGRFKREIAQLTARCGIPSTPEYTLIEPAQNDEDINKKALEEAKVEYYGAKQLKKMGFFDEEKFSHVKDLFLNLRSKFNEHTKEREEIDKDLGKINSILPHQ